MGRISKQDLEKKETVVETEEKQVEEKVEPKTTKATKTKSRAKAFKEKKSQIKKDASEIQVEVLNISDATAYYVSKTGIVYFDLEPSEDTLLTLDEVEEIMRTSKGFFKNDVLVITDVYSDDYTLADITEYLKLRDPSKIGYDYLEDFIVESDDATFKSKLEHESLDFVKRIACKAVYLDATEEYILPRSKETILCNLLNIQMLIGENER